MLRTTQPTVSAILGRLALLLFAAALAGSVAAHSGQEKYNGTVFFQSDAGPPDGPCVTIEGSLTAADFFVGLEKLETKNGYKFRRGSKEVHHFPQEMTVRLTLVEFPCHVGLLQQSPLKLTSEDMDSLRFEAYWKQGMRMRPAEKLTLRTVQEKKMPLQPPDSRKNNPPRDSESKWVYEFALTSAQVPLKDHLVFVIVMKDGRRLARVSARL